MESIHPEGLFAQSRLDNPLVQNCLNLFLSSFSVDRGLEISPVDVAYLCSRKSLTKRRLWQK